MVKRLSVDFILLAASVLQVILRSAITASKVHYAGKNRIANKDSSNATIIDYVQCLHDDIDHDDADDYLYSNTERNEFDPFATRTSSFNAYGYQHKSTSWPSFYHYAETHPMPSMDDAYLYYMPLAASDRQLPVDCHRFRRAVFATKQLETRRTEQRPLLEPSSSDVNSRPTGHVAADSRYRIADNSKEDKIDDSHVLFPLVFNLTAHAKIEANATCGLKPIPDVYCPLTDHVEIWRDQCNFCDARNPVMEHNISKAIDSSSSYWVSPPLSEGDQYQRVTITIDLRQIFLVAYVIIRSAVSPRPGVWILERSLDGVQYDPWQYYAPSNRECLQYFNTRAVPQNYHYKTDAEVACVTQFSGLYPLENGEVLTSLLNNRPGAREPSEELFNFTRARYVRIRLIKMRTISADLMTSMVRVGRNRTQVVDPNVLRRYFYSIRDIAVGGMCICYGHSHKCDWDTKTQHAPCACKHNTCGLNCERCCPLYNQQPWQIATTTHPAGCEKCQCFNQADTCQYNSTVAHLNLSLNAKGLYSGGGVCVNCRGNTRGINCQQCLPGYYRPLEVLRTDAEPCRECQCRAMGTVGDSSNACVQDETEMRGDLQPGDCLCKPGFAGRQCDRCALGYEDFPTCRPCICNYAGTTSEDQCDGVARRNQTDINEIDIGTSTTRTCTCKTNVQGAVCDQCRPGHFHLSAEHETQGCLPCFCFGISDKCSAVQWPVEKIAGVRDWLVSDRTGQNIYYPEIWNNMNEVVFSPNSNLAPLLDAYYWRGPEQFMGNRLTSYGGKLQYIASYVRSRGDLVGSLTHLPDVVLAGNDVRIGIVRTIKPPAKKRAISNETTASYTFEQVANINNNKDDVVTASFQLDENACWQFVNPTGSFKTYPRVDRRAIMTLLQNVSLVLLKASYQTHQAEMRLLYVALEFANRNGTLVAAAKEALPPALVHDASLPVEQCDCPFGYTGLSCEQCAMGYRRVDGYLQDGTCVPCNCHNHTGKCDPQTGRCLECQHNTDGFFCDQCAVGYYGDASEGRSESCSACACPLSGNQSVANECIAGRQAGMPRLDYVCLNCPSSYTGYHCDECVDGYFGQPSVAGGKLCSRCNCSNNIDPAAVGNCDTVSGKCLKCVNNTVGDQCEKCKPNYYGEAAVGNCTACQCFPQGSLDLQCNATSGDCRCRDNYEGKQCDRCLVGHGGIESDCRPCGCNSIGTKPKTTCDVVSGACQCQPGVFGLKCSQCSAGFYNFSSSGCTFCNCHSIGSANDTCDAISGQCPCKPNVEGRQCDRCAVGSWNLNPSSLTKSHNSELRVVSLTNRNNNDDDDENSVTNQRSEVNGKGCENCQCNKLGSLSYDCEQTTGQCRCRPGVTGRTCDQCASGYFGFSADGCMRCEPCDEHGHICDPFNGQCVCPPYTEGELCDRCAPNAYNFRPLIGCKPCQCDVHGAYNSTCEQSGGQCSCKPGYRGKTCDACNAGYFSFPVCIPCRCNSAGTLGQRCTTDAVTGRNVCECDDNGQCPCRPNVEGLKCDKCANGFFGLSTNKNQSAYDAEHSDESKEGCLSCYCFGRSQKCIAAQDYYWSRLLLPNQTISLRYEYVTTFSTADGSTDLRYSQPQLPVMADNRLVLPHNQPEARIRLPWFGIADSRLPFDSPLYWSLPREFLGNKLASYGGGLRFRVREEPMPSYMTSSGIDDDEQSPLIILGGNQRVRLYWNPDRRKRTQQYYNPLYTAMLWEKDTQWRARGERERPVSRADFMTALQRVEFILIRAHPYVNLPEQLYLTDAQMDEAVHVNRSVLAANDLQLRPAETVEQCLTCPATYAGLSCQDPAPGYMRTFEDNRFDSPDPAKMVGFAISCQCSNHSSRCDVETGECFDCSENTAGFWCEKCAAGYYGDPNAKSGQPLPCRRCLCPTAELIASQQCTTVRNGADYECQQCSEGYTGPKCNFCAAGYYGVPNENVPCRRCACNPYGSLSPTTCDRYTGQCICSSEVYTGRDCGQCQYGFVVAAGGICLDCIGRSKCFAILLNETRYELVEQLSRNVNVSALSMAQWTKLSSTADRYALLRAKYQSLGVMSPSQVDELIDLLRGGKFEDSMLITAVHASTAEKESNAARLRTEKLFNDTRTVLTRALHDVNTTMKSAVERLNAYYALASSEQRSTVQEQSQSEATVFLRRIHRNDEDPNYDTARDNAERELNAARSTVDRVQLARPSYAQINKVIARADAIRTKLAEAHKLMSDSVDEVAQSAVQKGTMTLREIGAVEKMSKNIKELTNLLNSTFQANFRIDNESKAGVQDAMSNFEVVHEALKNLDRQRKLVASATSERVTLNPQYEMEDVLLAELHSKKMLANATQLQAQLASSRDAASNPLRAAQAYEKITQSVSAASKASQEALDVALLIFELTTPTKTLITRNDALDSLAAKSQQVSSSLLAKSQALSSTKSLKSANKTSSISAAARKASENDKLVEQLSLTRARLQNSSATLVETENFFRKLHDHVTGQLETGLKNRTVLLAAVNDAIQQTSNSAEQLSQRVDVLRQRFQQELLPDASLLVRSEIVAGGDRFAGDVERHLNTSRNELQQAANKKVPELIRMAQALDDQHAAIRNRVSALRARILSARQRASSVQLSLTGAAEKQGVCIRQYEPNVQSSLANELLITYATPVPTDSAVLAFLSSEMSNNFMAIDIVGGRVRLSWQLVDGQSDGTSTIDNIIHPLVLQESFVKDYLNRNRIYQIRATLVGTQATLSVRPAATATVSGGSEDLAGSIVYGKGNGNSADRAYRFDVAGDAELTVGGLPNSSVLPSVRKWFSASDANGNGGVPRLAGCIFSVTVNGERMGLWNFVKSHGCDACTSIQSATTEPRTFRFADFAYARTKPNRRTFHSRRNIVTFEFKTFQADALLFLLANPNETSDFLSIELANGHLHYRFYLGGQSYVHISTPDTYNNGQWISVFADRNEIKGFLRVVDTYTGREWNATRSPTPRAPVVGGNSSTSAEKSPAADMPTGLEVVDGAVFFGGTSPGFKLRPPPRAQHIQPLGLLASRYANSAFFLVAEHFAGCMRNIQVDDNWQDLLREAEQYNIEAGCREHVIDSATFFKSFSTANSAADRDKEDKISSNDEMQRDSTDEDEDQNSVVYAKMHPRVQIGDDDFTFGLTFKTTTANGVVFAILDDIHDYSNGQDRQANRVKRAETNARFLIGVLQDNELQISIRLGINAATYNFKAAISTLQAHPQSGANNAKVNSLTIAKIGRVLEVRVNDVFADGSPINLVDIRVDHWSGVVFLGGVPRHVARTALQTTNLPTLKSFEGCISSLIYGNRLVGFEQVSEFRSVRIGECRAQPVPRATIQRYGPSMLVTVPQKTLPLLVSASPDNNEASRLAPFDEQILVSQNQPPPQQQPRPEQTQSKVAKPLQPVNCAPFPRLQTFSDSWQARHFGDPAPGDSFGLISLTGDAEEARYFPMEGGTLSIKFAFKTFYQSGTLAYIGDARALLPSTPTVDEFGTPIGSDDDDATLLSFDSAANILNDQPSSPSSMPSPHNVLVRLNEGRVECFVHSDGRKERHFKSQAVVDDGQWHTVRIELSASDSDDPARSSTANSKRQLTVHIDGLRIAKQWLNEQATKIPARIYFAGVPAPPDYYSQTFSSDLPNSVVQHATQLPEPVAESLRGCLANVSYDGNYIAWDLAQSVPSENGVYLQLVGARPCYENTERSAYFNGNAYVAYNADLFDTFPIGKGFMIAFSFRAATQNGMLVSAGDAAYNEPNLMIKLVNGRVVFTIQAPPAESGRGGGSRSASVTSEQNNLCDNRFHQIRATYANGVITLAVDNTPVQTDHNTLLEQLDTQGPLFVGGRMSTSSTGEHALQRRHAQNHASNESAVQAAGLVSSVENFVGCLQLQTLNGRNYRLEDFATRVGVMVDACPK